MARLLLLLLMLCVVLLLLPDGNWEHCMCLISGALGAWGVVVRAQLFIVRCVWADGGTVVLYATLCVHEYDM